MKKEGMNEHAYKHLHTISQIYFIIKNGKETKKKENIIKKKKIYYYFFPF